MSSAANVLVVSAVVGVLAGSPGQARGQGANSLEAVNKILQMNRQAMDLFGDREYRLARETLQEALRTVESSRLGDHFAAAITHGNLGIVAAVGYKDRAVAVKQFRTALAVKADYDLPGNVKDEEAIAALAAARGGVPPVHHDAQTVAPAGELAGDTGPLVKNGKVLRCPTGGEVLAGDDVALRCVTAPDARLAGVILFYKRLGDEEFTQVPMQPQPSPGVKGSSWGGTIPGIDVRGSWVPFYFEARDAAGEPIAQSGRYDSPSLLTIKSVGLDAGLLGAAEPGAGQGDEDPLKKKAAAAAAASAEERTARRMFVGLAVGSGFGYAAGPGIEAWRPYVRNFGAGFAGEGGGHALPELGYFVNPNLAFSIQGRLQYIPSVPRDKGASAQGAVSALARAMFFSGTDDARFYGSLMAGGGEGFRTVMDVRPVDAAGNPLHDKYGNTIGVVRDTVRGGPVLVGGGVGFSYDLGPVFEWLIETNALAGFPDFSLGFDVNTGLRARF